MCECGALTGQPEDASWVMGMGCRDRIWTREAIPNRLRLLCAAAWTNHLARHSFNFNLLEPVLGTYDAFHLGIKPQELTAFYIPGSQFILFVHETFCGCLVVNYEVVLRSLS
jgi:hypothetical protein